MLGRHNLFDEIDKRLLNLLQMNCKIPLSELSEKLSIAKSTIQYRIKRLEKEGIIEGYHAKLNTSILGNDIQAIIEVRAKFGPGFHEKVGKELAQIPGVWAVYLVFGKSDFVILVRGRNRKQLFERMKLLFNSENIERTTSKIVTNIIKENSRIFFEI